MEKLEHKTTEEHYNKYKDMAINSKINIKEFCNYISCIIGNLGELYFEDNYLNNIPLYLFDGYYHFYTRHNSKLVKIITNLADNVCVLKHLLIYEVLGATPIFVEVGKNYKDYPPLKK